MLFMFVLIALFFGGLMLITLFMGGHDASVDHDLAHGHGVDGGGWQAWFSLKVISAFGTAFGAAGAIATVNARTAPWATFIALLSGAVIGFLVKWLIAFLSGQEGSAAFRRTELAGKEGMVVLGILDGGIGEAQFMVDGQIVNLPARSSDGKAIGQGAKIVVDAVGSVLTVKKV